MSAAYADPPPGSPWVHLGPTLQDDQPEQALGDLQTMTDRMKSGAAFILDTPLDTAALWGDGDQVLWAEGESLILTGGPGVGKTTLGQQVILGMIGVGKPEVIGFSVARRDRVLYLAMDRPRQIAKSFSRMVTEANRHVLAERLVIWPGPPPQDLAKNTSILLAMALATQAQVVVIDSLKDAALGLTNDEVGAAVNRSIQGCLANGVDVLVLHHQTKRSGSGDGGKPTTLADVYGSAWITAGAGSVLLIAGDAGDLQVELRHLKQPSEPVGPLHIVHDHYQGTTTLADDDLDPLIWLRAQRTPITTRHLAAAIVGASGDVQSADVKRADRHLKRLVRNGLAVVITEAVKGGATGSLPATYAPAAHPGQGDLLEGIR